MDGEGVSSSCRDCYVTNLFSIIRVLIYVLSAIAVGSNGSEIAKNIFNMVSK